jgi:hypothetical protein
MTANELSGSQQDTLTLISAIVSTFSVVGSALIILSYVLFPNLRKFSYKLVLWLSFSDFFNQSMSYFGNPNDNLFTCKLQAAGMQFFSVSSFLWTASIAFVLRSTVIDKKADIEGGYRKMHVVIWSTAALTMLVPAWKYGPSGSWCWIEANDLEGKILRFICYYFPLWFTIGYNSFAYVSVIRFLRRVQLLANSMNENASQPRFEMKAISRLGWYPSILIITHSFGTVNRIQNWVEPHKPIFFLFLLHVITSSSMGLLNCLAYGVNQSVRAAWCERFHFLNRLNTLVERKENKFHKFENEMGEFSRASEGEDSPNSSTNTSMVDTPNKL